MAAFYVMELKNINPMEWVPLLKGHGIQHLVDLSPGGIGHELKSMAQSEGVGCLYFGDLGEGEILQRLDRAWDKGFVVCMVAKNKADLASTIQALQEKNRSVLWLESETPSLLDAIRARIIEQGERVEERLAVFSMLQGENGVSQLEDLIKSHYNALEEAAAKVKMEG